jgi:AcrR family transcriptional regulator
MERPPRQPAGAAVLQPDKTEAIVAAAFTELADDGWQGLSMDRVAARAGVGKAALYRRWPSKDAMLLDLIEQVGEHELLPPDTGHVRDDLVLFIDGVLAAIARPDVARIVPDALAHTRRSPELAHAIATRFRAPRRRAVRTVLERAVKRGELPKDADLELGLDLISGPLVLQAVVAEAPPPADYATRLTDAALRALSGPTP